MLHLVTTDPDPLVAALLAASAGGDVTIGFRDLGRYASAYSPDAGRIELNPTASPAEQRQGLLDHLRALVALDGIPTQRPTLELLTGGAS